MRHLCDALADAVLVFRGGADGAEPPVRVIQGHLHGPANSARRQSGSGAPQIIVSSLSGRSISIFPMGRDRNAAPLRVIRGPKARLGDTVGFGTDHASTTWRSDVDS